MAAILPRISGMRANLELTMPNRNSFNALCDLASREKWCWKINCTTCGHMLFRYGLHELQRGRHPDSPTWLVSEKHPDLFRGGEPVELGPLPPRWEPWPIAEQRQLVQVLVGANIHSIRADCTYPDWLGYLGLALKYSEDAEQGTRAITKAWVPQLMEERDGTRAQQTLRSILANNEVLLTWHHLEALE